MTYFRSVTKPAWYRTLAVLTLIGLFVWVGAQPTLGTEPGPHHDITLTCDGTTATVTIGEQHIVGHASYLTNQQEDSVWQETHLTPGVNHLPLAPGTLWVTVWVELDGQEIDPTVDCVTVTTTIPATTTTSSPVTSTTSTTPSTVPATTSTTQPVTTTTTSLPSCADQPDRWDCANTGNDQLSPFLVIGGLLLIVGVTGLVYTKVEL